MSAKKYAPSVVPVMLYPGNYNAYMKWFEQEGGLAFHHRTSLLPRWQVCDQCRQGWVAARCSARGLRPLVSAPTMYATAEPRAQSVFC